MVSKPLYDEMKKADDKFSYCMQQMQRDCDTLQARAEKAEKVAVDLQQKLHKLYEVLTQ